MKVIYCGTDVYLSSFKYFLENHEILALYTYHNDEDYFSESQIVKLAKENHIPISYHRINENDLNYGFNILKADLLVSLEYAYVIPIPEDLTSFKGINIHASYLPEGRGYYPIESAFDKGLDKTGVTIHKIHPKVDTGDIIYQEKIDLNVYKDSIDVYLKCAEIIEIEIQNLINDFDNRWLNAIPQNKLLPYWRKPNMSHALLHTDLTINEAVSIKEKFNKMTEIIIDGQSYFVRMMETSPLKIDKIVKVEDDLFLYPVKDGHLRLIVTKKGD